MRISAESDDILGHASKN